MSDATTPTTVGRVQEVLDLLPHARHNYTSLILGYWMLHDGIDIDPAMIRALESNGTPPESITRAKRMWEEHQRVAEAIDIQNWFEAEMTAQGRGSES